MVCPLNTEYKPFIVHLKSNKNGIANDEIDNAIKQIQKDSISTNFPIKYIAVDGDSHYSHSFKEQFDKIFNFLCQLNDFDLLDEKSEN